MNPLKKPLWVGIAIGLVTLVLTFVLWPRIVRLTGQGTDAFISVADGPLGDVALACQTLKIEGEIKFRGADVQFAVPSIGQVRLATSRDTIGSYQISLSAEPSADRRAIKLKTKRLTVDFNKNVTFTMQNGVTAKVAKIDSSAQSGGVTAEASLALGETITRYVTGGLIAPDGQAIEYATVAKMIVEEVTCSKLELALRDGSSITLPDGKALIASGSSVELSAVSIKPGERLASGTASAALSLRNADIKLKDANAQIGTVAFRSRAQISLSPTEHSVVLQPEPATLAMDLTNLSYRRGEQVAFQLDNVTASLQSGLWKRSRTQKKDQYELKLKANANGGLLEMKQADGLVTIKQLALADATCSVASDAGFARIEADLANGLTATGWSVERSKSDSSFALTGGTLRVSNAKFNSNQSMEMRVAQGQLQLTGIAIQSGDVGVIADFEPGSTVGVNPNQEVIFDSRDTTNKFIQGQIVVSTTARSLVVKRGDVQFPLKGATTNFTITNLDNPQVYGDTRFVIPAAAIAEALNPSLQQLTGRLIDRDDSATINSAEATGADVDVSIYFDSRPVPKVTRIKMTAGAGIGLRVHGTDTAPFHDYPPQPFSVSLKLSAVSIDADLASQSADVSLNAAVDCPQRFRIYSKLEKFDGPGRINPRLRAWLWVHEPFTCTLSLSSSVHWSSNGSFDLIPKTWTVVTGSPIKLKGEIGGLPDVRGSVDRIDARDVNLSWFIVDLSLSNPIPRLIDRLMGRTFQLRGAQ